MATQLNLRLSLCIMIVAFTVFLSSLNLIEAGKGGFSIGLIHRDSPSSPLYNPSQTPFDRLQNAIRRSITRIDHFKSSTSSPNAIESPVASNNGEYLMKISIGTPPVEQLAIADTGSDLIWIQCKPCESCYKQVGPLFDPKKSSTYKYLNCESQSCALLSSSSCSGSNNYCEYQYQYGDQSYSNGYLSADTFTFGSTTGRSVAFRKKIFGCGHNNDGTFNKHGSGLVGLGGGSLSLIKQLDSSIEGKFSYCLVPLSSENASSSLNFGEKGVVSGRGVVSTPLVAKDPNTFYYLTLEGISVGSKKLEYKNSVKAVGASSEGNIIIDSGTTLTMIPSEFYDDLESEVKSAIDLEPTTPPIQSLKLCYQTDTDFNVPTITVHFTGADVVLKPLNTFVRVSDNVICFAFIPSESFAIFGNLSQMDFLVGYDLENQKVSFKPTDCTGGQE